MKVNHSRKPRTGFSASRQPTVHVKPQQDPRIHCAALRRIPRHACSPFSRARVRDLYERSAVVAAAGSFANTLTRPLGKTLHAIIVKLAFCSGCLSVAFHERLLLLLNGQDLEPGWHYLQDEERNQPENIDYGIPASQIRLPSSLEHRQEADQLTVLL
jgi:hypothetical protein